MHLQDTSQPTQRHQLRAVVYKIHWGLLGEVASNRSNRHHSSRLQGGLKHGSQALERSRANPDFADEPDAPFHSAYISITMYIYAPNTHTLSSRLPPRGRMRPRGSVALLSKNLDVINKGCEESATRVKQQQWHELGTKPIDARKCISNMSRTLGRQRRQ